MYQRSGRAGAADPTLPITVAATLLVLIDFTAVLPTLQDTGATFGASVGWRTWALSGMSLGLAAALLTAGTVADRLGRRRTLRAGLVTLAVGAAVAAAAPSIAVFVAARIAQGVAGAAVVASALASIGAAYPTGPKRLRATGIWGAALGGGIAAGPVLSALVARVADWRAAYWVVAALIAAVAVWAARLPESRSTAARNPDLPGAVAFVAAMSALTAALITARDSWTSAVTIVLLVVAIASLAAFAVIEAQAAEPMLDLRLLRRPDFVTSVVGALVVGLSTIALMCYASTYFEHRFGLSAVAGATLLAVWSATSALTSWHAHRLPGRLSSRHRLLAGFVGCTGGLAWLAQYGAGGGWAELVPGLLLTGVGSGVSNAALAQLAVTSAPAGRPGLGSGSNNTARYLGGAAGIAVVVALAVPSSATPTTAQLVHGWNTAAWASAAMCALGLLVVAVCRPSRRGAPARAGTETGAGAGAAAAAAANTADRVRA